MSSGRPLAANRRWLILVLILVPVFIGALDLTIVSAILPEVMTRLNIPWQEVLTREPEEDEIKQLQSLRVTQESLKEFILRHHGNISATGEPNLLMYGGLRFGEGWFGEVMRRIVSL